MNGRNHIMYSNEIVYLTYIIILNQIFLLNKIPHTTSNIVIQTKSSNRFGLFTMRPLLVVS